MLNIASTLGGTSLSLWRGYANERACTELTAVVAEQNPGAFEATFGAPTSALPELLAAKTVTISQLMTCTPAGVTDPSCYLYHEALFALAGMSFIGCAGNIIALSVGPFKGGVSAAGGAHRELKGRTNIR